MTKQSVPGKYVFVAQQVARRMVRQIVRRIVRRIVRLRPAWMVVGLVLGTILLGCPAAQAVRAAGAGALTFIPAKGMDISPIYVVTSAPCPAEATNLVGRIFGAGLPAAGTVVIPNSDAALRHDVGFGVPLQDTLRSFAQRAGTTLSGKYRISLACTDELATRVYAQFIGTISFSDHTHFTGPAPKTPPAQGVPVGFLAQVFSEFKVGSGPAAPGAAAPDAAAAPNAAVTPEAAAATPAAATPVAPGPLPAEQAGSEAGSSFNPSIVVPVIIVLLCAVIGVVGFVVVRKNLTPVAGPVPGAPRRPAVSTVRSPIAKTSTPTAKTAAEPPTTPAEPTPAKPTPAEPLTQPQAEPPTTPAEPTDKADAV